MNHVLVGIGSNIDAERNVEYALSVLQREQKLEQVSERLKTLPVGITDQSDFINAVAAVYTELSQSDFKRYLKNVEDRMGRDRSLPKFGPRVIDLDIEVWNGTLVDRDYFSRKFLRKLLAQLNFHME